MSMTSEKLGRLRNRPTLYELAMVRGDEKILVAYVQRKGRRDLWKAITNPKRIRKIVAKAGTEEITFRKKAGDGGQMGEWSLRFTGRTERDAVAEGELPYIGAESV